MGQRTQLPSRSTSLTHASLDTSRLRDLAISDAGFVFDPTTGHTYNMNPTALFIVSALKSGEPADTIVAQLGDAFEIKSESDVARDFGDFVSRCGRTDW